MSVEQQSVYGAEMPANSLELLLQISMLQSENERLRHQVIALTAALGACRAELTGVAVEAPHTEAGCSQTLSRLCEGDIPRQETYDLGATGCCHGTPRHAVYSSVEHVPPPPNPAADQGTKLVKPPPGLSSPKCPSTVARTDSAFPGLLDCLQQAEKDTAIRRTCPLINEAAEIKNTCEPADSTIRIARFPEGTVTRTRVEWTVVQIQAKLKANSGFPLVSPTFTIEGLPPLRLLFAPGTKWAANRKASMGCKQRSSRRIATATDTNGAQFGSLKLKAACVNASPSATFNVTVGSIRIGPFRCDFYDKAVQCCDIPEDWTNHVQVDGDSLRLAVEVVDE